MFHGIAMRINTAVFTLGFYLAGYKRKSLLVFLPFCLKKNHKKNLWLLDVKAQTLKMTLEHL